MAQIEKKEQRTPSNQGATAPARTPLELLPSRLFDRIEHLLGRFEPFGSMPRWPEELLSKAPATDLFQEGDDLVVETELPGMRKEDLEITLTGDVLTISGKRELEKREERRDYFRLERSATRVSRTIRLPVDVQPDKMTAALKDGVLVVRAPRAGGVRSEAHRIPII